MIRSIIRSGTSACRNHKIGGVSGTVTRATHRNHTTGCLSCPLHDEGSEQVHCKARKGPSLKEKIIWCVITVWATKVVVARSAKAERKAEQRRQHEYELRVQLEDKHRVQQDEDDKLRMPSHPYLSFAYMKELACRDEYMIEKMLREKNMSRISYPMFSVTAEGQKININLDIPPNCYIPDLIGLLVSNLGLKVEERPRGSDMKRRHGKVDWKLTSSYEHKQTEAKEKGIEVDDDLTILISSDNGKSEIEFVKSGVFSEKELQVFVSALKFVGESTGKKAATQ